ncbi:MAG: hypothetical protein V5A44_04955 [Haloarculaceae archaeon]
MPTVRRIWTAPEGSPPMESRERVRAVADGGLRGDRYCHDRGYYSPYDVCQVTLVDSAAIEHVREAYDIDLADGRHRRNVVVDADVVEGGEVAVGDELRVLERLDDPDSLADAIRERHGE